jgi:hypothetical protein
MFLYMPGQAQITSVEAIEAFRAQLVVYLAQMRPVLDEVSNEAMRTRAWLEDDRKRYWTQELKKRNRKLEEAKQELFTATLSKMGEATSLHQMAVQRASRAVREVEDKLVVIRKWERELENRTSPLVKQMEQLHGFLTVDMAKAVAYLEQVLAALAAYQDIASGPSQSTGGPK